MLAHVPVHVLELEVCHPVTLFLVHLHCPPTHAILQSVQDLETSVVVLTIGKPSTGGE